MDIAQLQAQLKAVLENIDKINWRISAIGMRGPANSEELADLCKERESLIQSAAALRLYINICHECSRHS